MPIASTPCTVLQQARCWPSSVQLSSRVTAVQRSAAPPRHQQHCRPPSLAAALPQRDESWSSACIDYDEPADHQLERTIAGYLLEQGEHDGLAPDPSTVSRLAEAVRWLRCRSVQGHTSLSLVLDNTHLLLHNGSIDTYLAAKFDVLQRYACAEEDAAQLLATALVANADCGALALPVESFEAALQFAASQLQRLSRRRYRQLHQPYSLHRFMQYNPYAAGAVLAQHPAPFQQQAAPWLRQNLGWDDAALADAALTCWMPDLCQLDHERAQVCLDWLLSTGLSQSQAGQLLQLNLRLLASRWPRDLEAAQRRVQALAPAWDTSQHLTAALALSQPEFAASAEDRTGRLLCTLRDVVGMSEAQLLSFALAGGLGGSELTRSEPALQATTERLKDLLMVYGGWPSVGGALAAEPDLLTMSWGSVGSVLESAQQRQAWRRVAALALHDSNG